MSYVDTRLGGIPRYYMTPPEDADMRVPEVLRQCVVFIGVSDVTPGGQPTLSFRGTAFFVTVSSESRVDQGFYYLVTAKHVARRLRGREIIVRANTKDGRSQTISSGGPMGWWHHPADESVDVAVTPFGLSTETFEYKHIPTDMFLSDEGIRDKKIGTGDEVFIVGLFTSLSGKARNLPIVRMGNIAMMPSERVPIKDYGTIEAYLIEARSIGGISGSPVFVQETTRGGVGTIYLLGLMYGHWDVPPAIKNDAITVEEELLKGVNMGIAIVIPAKKILEVLMQPGLVAIRRKADEEALAQHLPTEDAILEKR
jgi:hypothetical protein